MCSCWSCRRTPACHEGATGYSPLPPTPQTHASLHSLPPSLQPMWYSCLSCIYLHAVLGATACTPTTPLTLNACLPRTPATTPLQAHVVQLLLVAPHCPPPHCPPTPHMRASVTHRHPLPDSHGAAACPAHACSCMLCWALLGAPKPPRTTRINSMPPISLPATLSLTHAVQSLVLHMHGPEFRAGL